MARRPARRRGRARDRPPRVKVLPEVPLRRRLRNAIPAGLVVGVFLTMFPGPEADYRGWESPPPWPLPVVPRPIVFLALGPLTGLLFALLFPRMRAPRHAYAVGAFASLPVALGTAAVITGQAWTSPAVLLAGAGVSLTLGGGAGLVVRDASLTRRRVRAHPTRNSRARSS